MLTVVEVARRLNKDPETVRRWIRSGKLPARKVGLQFLVDEADVPASGGAGLPPGWGVTATGEPMPDILAALGRSRAGR